MLLKFHLLIVHTCVPVVTHVLTETWEITFRILKKHFKVRVVDEKYDLHLIAGMIRDMNSQEKSTFVFVNNHYEGSAPLTIQKLQQMIGEAN